MHYHAEVWVPQFKDFAKGVEFFMAPWHESLNARNRKDKRYGIWDYFMLGGGWSGIHESEGEMLRITNAEFHPIDIMNVLELRGDLTCHTLILPEKAPILKEYFVYKPNGKSYYQSTEFGTKFRSNVVDYLDFVGIRQGFLVTVDYHR